MAFTMHSHSGQFCPGHAKDELENVVKHAISIGYKTIGLTEHMPRTELSDLYPEEVSCCPSISHRLATAFSPAHIWLRLWEGEGGQSRRCNSYTDVEGGWGDFRK